ncbi:MAG: hypothetical protein EAZ57_05210 [Cytophagales bacterium]|nr:MAG: hypothetical protein EAZ67_06370 [Cytophagales bacterium]TAF60949.1 MAG: hypothetical protein EAZ57_05210 [Cytophagales bacterium]
MNETELIEHYLQGLLTPEDRLLLEAKLLLYPDLKQKIELQSLVYDIAKVYGEQALRQDIATAERKLFTESRFQNFRSLIFNIFN